jgi:DMSO reductase anchor subunit
MPRECRNIVKIAQLSQTEREKQGKRQCWLCLAAIAALTVMFVTALAKNKEALAEKVLTGALSALAGAAVGVRLNGNGSGKRAS